MNKKIILLLILFSSILFSACTKTDNSTVNNSDQATSTPIAGVEVKQKPGNCQPGEVTLDGYGDKGKMLANCFVEYPGEPSRQDKSYYIVEDICGQFTDKLISASLGKNIVKAKSPDNFNANNCTYYIDEEEYIMLVLNYLSIDNQKKGHESMDRKTVEDPKIPMRNMVVYQEDGQINSIYLVLSDDKFISIQRSSAATFTSDELINFASNIGQVIKNYK
jgi:hypothetical protein